MTPLFRRLSSGLACRTIWPWLLFVMTIGMTISAHAARLDSILGQKQPQFLSVEQAFEITTEQAPEAVNISIDIAPGYYLYRDRLTISMQGGQAQPIDYPAALSHEDEYFGKQAIYRDHVELTVPYSLSNADATFTLHYMGCADAGLCYPPSKLTIPLSPDIAQRAGHTKAVPDIHDTPAPPTAENRQHNLDDNDAHSLARRLAHSHGVLTLGIFFVLGLGLALTPCVFPMYPILAAVIAGSQQRPGWLRSLLLSFCYVQGMAVTYTLLGLIVASLGLQFQVWFQHPVVLITLSVLFSALALSMFSQRFLQLPLAWQNALNRRSSKLSGGKILPVFGLGIIAGLVASPCTTAPLTGALLYVAQSGDQWLGAAALYALSLGMGIPLLIVGVLGQRILPKQGPWMTTVKQLFGFVLFAVPILLLDRLWPTSWTMTAWGLLLLIAGAYLLITLLGTRRSGFTVLAIAGSFLLMFGGASLLQQTWLTSETTVAANPPTNISFTTVHSVAELEQQLSAAQAQGKPVLLDVFAKWCIACKEFDQKTFPDPAVQQQLQSLVLLRADVTANSPQDQALMHHLNILGLPSLLLYDAQGNEQHEHRIAGFLGPQAFIQHLQQTFPNQLGH